MKTTPTLPPEIVLDNLEAMLDHFGITLFAADPTGKLIYGNKTLTDYTDGQQDAGAIDPKAWADCQAIMASGHPQESEEQYQDTTFLSFKKPLLDGKKSLGILGMAIDITARKAAEQQLRQAKQCADEATATQSRFIANMSHNLRLPFIQIMGIAQHCLATSGKTFYLSTHYPDYLHLLTCSMQGLKAVDDILNYITCIDQTLQSPEHTIDLPAFCQALFERYEPLAMATEITLEQVIEANCPQHITTCPATLHQILSALLDNALKFTTQGRILFSVNYDSTQQQLRWSVTDSGQGIPPDDLARIFEPFERLTPAAQTQDFAPGLGLSKAKQLTEQLGGQLTVTSELNQGACFTCALPWIDAVATESAINPPPTQPATADRVLVVEDDAITQLIVTQLLKKQGCHVDTASNGQEAVEQAQQHHYAFIFMDIGLPDFDGCEATRRIRAAEKNHNAPPTPIIALTAHCIDEMLSQRCAAAGMQEFLQKPLTAHTAAQIVARYIKASPPASNIVPLPTPPMPLKESGA